MRCSLVGTYYYFVFVLIKTLCIIIIIIGGKNKEFALAVNRGGSFSCTVKVPRSSLFWFRSAVTDRVSQVLARVAMKYCRYSSLKLGASLSSFVYHG